MTHHDPKPPILHSFSSPDALTKSLADFIVEAQNEAIDKKGKFTVALSGGSLPKQLSALVGHPGVKWKYWCALVVYRRGD